VHNEYLREVRQGRGKLANVEIGPWARRFKILKELQKN